MSTVQTAVQTYQMQQIYSAGPLDLLIMAYDAALIGCNRRDLQYTTRALTELSNALDFNYDPDIALGFHRLYTWCGDLARQGEFDQAAGILRELRDAWLQVKQQYQPAVVSQPNAYTAGKPVKSGPAMPVPSLAGSLA
jgi:flagellin-specific chaperone FliS